MLARDDDPTPDAAAVDLPEVGASTTRRVMRGALMLLSTQPITWAASLAMTIFVPRPPR